jgi:hypothetical protein
LCWLLLPFNHVTYKFKICFTESHNIKPLFPTYKPREWTKRSRKCKQKGTPQELAPIWHQKEIETNIGNKSNSNEIPPSNTSFHAMKFWKAFKAYLPEIHLLIQQTQKIYNHHDLCRVRKDFVCMEMRVSLDGSCIP